MATEPITPESIKSFAAEYRALCLKYGVRVTFDWGYRASGVDKLNEHDLADNEWDLYPEGNLTNEMVED